MIVEPNWGVFSAKFNGKEQKTFEWLCSLLFAKEYKQPIGALRYFNQAGIEEDPISAGSEVIGWQAKFVGRISEQTQTLKKAIDDAKSKNPSLTRIQFYLNVDFPQGKKPGVKDPQYKIDIEGHAKSKGVAIMWRTRSFFEKPFVCEENANIARHFFTGEKGVIDLIQELTRHTEAVLELIRSEIRSGGSVIKIDRRPLVARLRDTLQTSPLVIVIGEAGVGKTAVVKDFYAELEGTAPLFVFKATELNVIASASQLFRDYGAFTISDLVQAFSAADKKYVVIDSAEELARTEHPEVFQEILSTLRLAGWKIIFTTRLNYLEDLERTLIHIYGAQFEPLNVEKLTSEELSNFSAAYQFVLPENDRLRSLLQNPFYLNEYLRENPKGQTKIGYSEFREAMWNARIAKTSDTRNNAHRKREQCFLDIARRRAVTGSFFVSVDGADEVLPQLEADEIIKFDPSSGGYFIAHDIYAEWALDKIIERSFALSSTFTNFYEAIGSSLPIRRAFRNWLSEKLLLNDGSAKRLIEETIDANGIERHWKDEVIIAALLSPYADVFISYVSAALLTLPERFVEEGVSTPVVRSVRARTKYEDQLLTKILFLLRIACKDIDQELLRTFGAQGSVLAQFFAKPRGAGWSSVIAFVHEHREELGLMYMHLILPVLDEWNQYNKQGAATRDAARMALFYYHKLTEGDGHFPYGTNDDTKERLIRTIFNGSAEIAIDLKAIFDEVVAKKEVSRENPYYELAHAALGDLVKTSVISQHLPKEIMALADLFWTYRPPKKRGAWYSDHRSDIDMETYFGLASKHHEYYPASAFQTPTFGLLKVKPKHAIDFIIAFANKATEYFAKTELGKSEVEEIEIRLDDGSSIKQYVCNRIWNLYRGTQVAPDVLESVHMALERWLLQYAKFAQPSSIEGWCLYLIEHSRSASITALVTSVVLSQPSKLFNVAKILFRTKELFFYEMARMQLDMSAKSTLAICHDPTGVFRNERVASCDDEHRRASLEHLALKYQLFRYDGEDENVAKSRQEVIWRIFDDYYAQLPDPITETDGDKTWRLCLARMDRRKMNITTETKDDQVYISFNPAIDPELKQYSEEAVAKTSEAFKYTPLRLWANYRFELNEAEYKKYPQYEDDPKRTIADTKVILDGLNDDKSEDQSFSLFYKSVPAYVCAVLLRDYFDRLDADDQAFCKNVVLDFASVPLGDGYQYQVRDGVGAATTVLPLLIKSFPAETARIKTTLLFGLFNENGVGMGQNFSEFAVSAVVDGMWAEHADDANSLFLGYVLLKPKLDAIRKLIREENYRLNRFQFFEKEVLERFVTLHKDDIDRVITNDINYDRLPSLASVGERVLVIAFSMLPHRTDNEFHKEFVQSICKLLSARLLERNSEDRFDYALRRLFFDKLAVFLLNSNKRDIEAYLRPFLDQFTNSREVADMLSAFVSAEDKLHQYDQFWTIWGIFYPHIKQLCERVSGRFYSPEVIHNYLLAWPYWRKDAKEWRSVKAREKVFFRKVAEEIGGHPAVFYSIAKCLNEIGSGFVDDGVAWIAGIIERTPDLASAELEVNTVYYLENLMRSYLLANRGSVRASAQIQRHVLTILNFLLEKGSATAYLLREDILH